MAAHYGWFPTILEGDSQIILQMTTKLLHGKPVNKVDDTWKMAHSLEQLRALLRAHSKVQNNQVKRKANKLADLLENYGVSQRQELQQKQWGDRIEASVRWDCQRVVE